MPALQAINANHACRFQRGCPSSEAYEPNLMPDLIPASRALTHFSGSFSRVMTTTHSSAGNDPTRNIACHGFMPNGNTATAPISIPSRPAERLPTVESDCRRPSAGARAVSDTESATNATARPNTPPTPTPVMNRYTQKSKKPVERQLRPVNSE